jgi:hypothetical protein
MTVTIVLAQATLAGMMQIEMILSLLHRPRQPKAAQGSPRRPKASSHVSLSLVLSPTNVANVNEPLSSNIPEF